MFCGVIKNVLFKLFITTTVIMKAINFDFLIKFHEIAFKLDQTYALSAKAS